jgi:hypothetical protein
MSFDGQGMVATFLVTFDLVRDTRRAKIRAEVEGSERWVRLSEGSYAIATPEAADEVYQRLLPLLEANDVLYVIALCRPFAGQGLETVNDWLVGHVPGGV